MSCGRKRLCAIYWRAIEDVENVSFDDLGDPGRVLEHYDGKVHVAVLDAVGPALRRKIARVEAELWKAGKFMSGRQSLRMVYDHFKTDRTSRELFSVTHLHALLYRGDDRYAPGS